MSIGLCEFTFLFVENLIASSLLRSVDRSIDRPLAVDHVSAKCWSRQLRQQGTNTWGPMWGVLSSFRPIAEQVERTLLQFHTPRTHTQSLTPGAINGNPFPVLTLRSRGLSNKRVHCGVDIWLFSHDTSISYFFPLCTS